MFFLGPGPRARRRVALAFVVAFVWLGCGASSDDEGDDFDPDDPFSSSPGSGGGSTGNPPSPAFEAGFEDDASDSTPDGGDTCIDDDDPGAAENVAKKLPDTDDCDNAFKTVHGVANGAVDVDFYSLSGTDKGGCVRRTMFESPTAGLELCVFLRCKKGSTNLTSCTHGVLTESDIGMRGCCSATPGKALPSWSCGGRFQFDDSADMFIRVRQPSGNACVPYSFDYRY
jgi:hypothetical protein